MLAANMNLWYAVKVGTDLLPGNPEHWGKSVLLNKRTRGAKKMMSSEKFIFI